MHEVIPPSGRRISLPLPIEHRKLKAPETGRNLRIFEGLLKKGKSLTPRQQLYYARELVGAGRDPEAAVWLKRFLDERGGWLEDNIRACLDLAACRERLGDWEGALNAVFSSFVFDSPRAEAAVRRAAFSKAAGTTGGRPTGTGRPSTVLPPTTVSAFTTRISRASSP